MRESITRPLGLDAVITGSWALAGVRAGSALVRVGERLLLAQDDEYTLVWIDELPKAADAAGPRLHALPLHERRRALAKAVKPDFEAAAAMPDGRLLVVGSGSSPTRRTVVTLEPATGDFELHDASGVFALVTEALGHDPNLEAVLWVQDHLRLFHRGAGPQASVTIDLSLDLAKPDRAHVLAVQAHRLGEVPGRAKPVPLSFTDADLDHQGRQWYLAAAEDTPNAIDDGPVVGAALGRLDPEGPCWTLLREADGQPSVRKAEGLALDDDACGGWVVTDPDDAHRASELCRFELTTS